MNPKPSPPNSIPKYLREGIDRQDPSTLRDVAAWASNLAEWQERDLSPDEIVSEAASSEEVTDIQDGSSGTIVTKLVPCGKECSGCPHGPYDYRVTREGDSLNWEYLGKSTED